MLIEKTAITQLYSFVYTICDMFSMIYDTLIILSMCYLQFDSPIDTRETAELIEHM